MKAGLPCIVLGAALSVSAWPVRADPVAALQRCRQIVDVLARVACYDAIPLPVPASKGGAVAAVVPAPAAAESAPSRPAVTPAAPAGAALPTATASAAAPVAATAPTPDPNFGLSVTRPPAANDAVVSTIAGLFNGWIPEMKLTLANAQVWQINDGSTGAFPPQRDPKVRITRGLLGSFFLEVEGVGPTPRVKRLQ